MDSDDLNHREGLQESEEGPAHMGNVPCAVAILAGGLSSRMGHDKASLRSGEVSLLERIHSNAQSLGYPVHVIAHDIVPRCGPLGGIFTAFASIQAESILFLPCDMPFVSPALLRLVAAPLSGSHLGRFVEANGQVGFPFQLRSGTEPIVRDHLEKGAYSINELADAIEADRIMIPKAWRHEIFNINRPEDWEAALEMMR